MEITYDGRATFHHVHAEDIDLIVMVCIHILEALREQAFRAKSEQSLTLRGFAEFLYAYFAHNPNIKYLMLKEFASKLDEKTVATTLEHILQSPACSIEKIEKLLSFVIKWYSIDTVIFDLEYKIARVS